MAESKTAIDSREVIGNEAKSIGGLTYKLTLDVSEALAGLKALQREARKATQAVRGVESAEITVHDLQLQAIKDSLKDGNKAEQGALALITEFEQRVAELERKVSESIREVTVYADDDELIASITKDNAIVKNGYNVKIT